LQDLEPDPDGDGILKPGNQTMIADGERVGLFAPGESGIFGELSGGP
jgi:hypothetical protein